ncbi:transcriptional regulator, LysR family [Albimonas donghaensis]|uniref:HTH-type transcriptional regulator MetR n=1 Tax=Albimonas donghaensis TaxID=356660 RepID=A0A1H2R760_9RHOB|nr:LysR family transcriptional regulator [Albimonas donghaensis]SDW14509.1 transcriptional regulator, LysR family [Albimonas donghaensis]
MLDRQHLAILREVDRQGGVTAAADRLNMTQSAVSHAIRRLERELEATLWERDGRRLRLTRAGRRLLTLANRVLPQIEQAEAEIAEYAGGRRGALRIGMECHPCYRWLLKVVQPYLAAWPDVDLDVKQAFQFGGLGALLGHEIDLLITPDPVLRAPLTFTPVFGYELVLAVAADHRLAGREVVTPEDLEREQLITYPVPVERLDVFTRFLLPAHRLPRGHRTVETTDVMLQMVAAGRGVAPLPDWLLTEARGGPPLVPLRLGPEGISKSIHVGYRTADAGVEFLSGFLDLARGVAPAGGVDAEAAGG